MQDMDTDGSSSREVTPVVDGARKNPNFIDATQKYCEENVKDSIALNGRPVLTTKANTITTTTKTGTTTALRRQPTMYPHSLGITIQTTAESEHYKSYSRASTLRSDSWNGGPESLSATEQGSAYRNKYRISMIGNPESLAELQVRRYKYPLTGNYYLDAQDQIAKAPWIYEYFDHAKRYCRWKYMRWPIIFLASVLLFFGLITYCIWLHDVSVAREHFMQQRRLRYGLELSNEIKESSEEEMETTIRILTQTAIVKKSTTGIPTMTTTTTTQSTLLHAMGNGARFQEGPKEQKLTTLDYDVSKGIATRNKEKINFGKRVTLPTETSISTGDEMEDYVALQRLRFTSGHQNSFGIPIEEDERILSFINSLNASNQPITTSITPPQTKVSPTIPPMPPRRIAPTAAMGDNNVRQAAINSQENRCYSTSLPMCRGVLDYDLTYNATIQLSPAEQESYKSLIMSNCSARAAEFVCALLEPECRPTHIGILPPCRRICKAILEACSIVIENSDILSSTFDCNLYPDSSDPHQCEDPTRRTFCYDNEFECYDRSCIPHQWQCDNIKDCAAGEDENECLQCDHQDEFRCRSNDKCVPEAVRCDSKFDCFDGSDEDDCEEYGSGDDSAAAFDEAALNSFPRVFSYASYLSPNQSNEEGALTYFTATTDEESNTKFEVHKITNRTSGVSKEEVTNNVPGIEGGPKGFVNFRDSKEIMMTSDSENKFKYSAVRLNRTGSRFSTPAPTLRSVPTRLQAVASQMVTRTTRKPVEKTINSCAPHQLRCVSGKCITVEQLCDKKIDCSDGADELGCIYKELRSSIKSSNNGTASYKDDVTTDSTPTAGRRTLRPTFKRKLKV